jgi:hypothetical protein
MADVVIKVEMLVIDPYRVTLERYGRQPLPIAGNHMEPRVDYPTDPVDVHPAATCGSPRTEERHSTDVHVRVSRLEREERCIEIR